MTKPTNTLKAAVASIDAIALDLETVPRGPDSVVDRAIAKLRQISRHTEPYKRDDWQPSARIVAYREHIIEVAADLKSIAEDTPGGTIKSAIEDLVNVAEYLLGCVNENVKPRPVAASIQVPPKMQGEPAEALDKPAKVTINAEKIVVQGSIKIDASKGESIVQACAQIRGLISDNAHGVWRQHLLDQVSTIEDQAFSKDTPTFALNANGNPLDDEQVELIRCIKATQRELLSLASSTRNYLLAKQKRLKAICDANPCNDIDHELTVEQAVAYGAYRDFTNADGYGWVQRGVSDVQVGVMALVRAIAGPTE